MFIVLYVWKKTDYLGTRLGLGRNHRMPMLKQAHACHHAYGHILGCPRDYFWLTQYLGNLGLFPHMQNDEHLASFKQHQGTSRTVANTFLVTVLLNQLWVSYPPHQSSSSSWYILMVSSQLAEASSCTIRARSVNTSTVKFIKDDMVGVAIQKAKSQSICPVLRLLFYLCRPESEATRLSCTYALAQGTTPYLTPSQHTSSVGCQRTHFTSWVWWWSTLAHSKSSPSSRTETRNSKPDNLSPAHLYYNGVMSNTKSA